MSAPCPIFGFIVTIAPRDALSATNADRDLVRPWAIRRADRVTIVIGDLVDLD